MRLACFDDRKIGFYSVLCEKQAVKIRRAGANCPCYPRIALPI